MSSNTIAFTIVGCVLILATLLGMGVINIPGKTSNSKDSKAAQGSQDLNSTKSDTTDATIQPTPFKTGYIKESPQKLANLCKDDYAGAKNNADFNNAKYPINPVYVNYGGKPIPDDCKCLEFIKAP